MRGLFLQGLPHGCFHKASGSLHALVQRFMAQQASGDHRGKDITAARTAFTDFFVPHLICFSLRVDEAAAAPVQFKGGVI